METEEKETSGLGKPLIGVVLLAVGLVVGFFVGGVRGGGDTKQSEVSSATERMEIKLSNHIQANLPEQDVFVAESDGESVRRVDVAEGKDAATMSQEVFRSEVAVGHDPFKLGENPLGPFSKGESLGMTLGEWLAATGEGTYEVNGGTASLNLELANLVPSGVYTVWCSKIKLPPEPLVVDVPCGALDGSENVFKAKGDGTGEFTLAMRPLEPSTKSTVNVLAVAYHSDGQTYGMDPGPFGQKTHVQLFFLAPAPEAE